MSEMDKKAYEIAYALCRIAEKTGEPLGGILSNKGLQLLAAIVENNIDESNRIIVALGYFVKLGSGLGLVSQGNTDTLVSQLNLLKTMVDQSVVVAGSSPISSPKDVDISDIFSSAEPSPAAPITPSAKPEKSSPTFSDSIAGYPAIEEVKKSSRSLEEKKPVFLNEDNDSAFAPLISSDIRQSEILDLIRQSGNCRMKDLQDMFPRCSERTLRYDLESLIGRGLIERIGAGSATSYQPADLVSSLDSLE